jgi:hypothetical protein
MKTNFWKYFSVFSVLMICASIIGGYSYFHSHSQKHRTPSSFEGEVGPVRYTCKQLYSMEMKRKYIRNKKIEDISRNAGKIGMGLSILGAAPLGPAAVVVGSVALVGGYVTAILAETSTPNEEKVLALLDEETSKQWKKLIKYINRKLPDLEVDEADVRLAIENGFVTGDFCVDRKGLNIKSFKNVKKYIVSKLKL